LQRSPFGIRKRGELLKLAHQRDGHDAVTAIEDNISDQTDLDRAKFRS
jgi:hypothetical protein